METNNSKILFYEWSNLKNTPLGFLTTDDFINFCKQSRIKISKRNLNFLSKNDIVYGTCPINHSMLTLSGDKRNLQKNFSKHNCKTKR